MFWTLYLAGVAAILALPTATALIKRSRDLPLILGLNALGLVLPVPCWIAAMGFAILGTKNLRGRKQPPWPDEPGRFPSPARTVRPVSREKEDALL